MSTAPGFVEVAGPGDDALLVVTVDALVSGVHFPDDTAVPDVACKSLAVNLSDLAAMGAEPLSGQALCESPHGDEAWPEALAAAMQREASGQAGFSLTVTRDRGPARRVVVQVMGGVPRGLALTRDGARAGDHVWVSGTPGDAGAGLAIAAGRLDAGADSAYLRERLDRPQPRIALGIALRGVASAAVDVSDGIAGDAGHVARRSRVSMLIEQARIPVSDALRRAAGEEGARQLATFAGDDYELLFTAPAGSDDAVRRAGVAAGTAVHRIGRVEPGEGVRIVDASGRAVTGAAFEHFRAAGPGP